MAQKPSIPKGTRDFSPVEMSKRNYIFDTIRKAVDDWKMTLPLKEEKADRRKDHEVVEASPRITRISDVISRVISFELESSSPMEAYEFLRVLRRDISAIF